MKQETLAWDVNLECVTVTPLLDISLTPRRGCVIPAVNKYVCIVGTERRTTSLVAVPNIVNLLLKNPGLRVALERVKVRASCGQELCLHLKPKSNEI